MQLVEAPTRATEATIAIGPSLAVELSWVLLAAHRDQLRDRHRCLQALYGGPGAMEGRVLSFWRDGVADFGEELVLADRAGLIATTGIDELLAGIASAAAHGPRELRLASEDSSDRAVFLNRLERLARSARLRRDYVALLRELWAGLEETWRKDGRPLVEAATERLRRRLERGASWLEIVTADSEHLSSHLPGLIAKVAPVASVTIVPSLFSGQGLLLDLPGGVLIGLAATTSDPGTRARTDLVARRLKALSDPTRLAIAYSLGDGPMTVGEIARSFELAQPTVSNHLKLLREAGIVKGTRHGNRLELEVRTDATNELLDDLRAMLNREAAPGQSAPKIGPRQGS
jgi:DNA-binding transcriptional ArsR family regulator